MDLAHGTAALAWANQWVPGLRLREADAADHLAVRPLTAIFVQHDVGCDVFFVVTAPDSGLAVQRDVFVRRSTCAPVECRDLLD